MLGVLYDNEQLFIHQICGSVMSGAQGAFQANKGATEPRQPKMEDLQ
jgi:hypothetical protein